MNCSVCGSPLLFDRVVFRCECGAYVHAYCVDKHIVSSHRPALEEGYADLNGEFHLKFKPVVETAPGLSSVPSGILSRPVEVEEEGGEDLIGEEALEALESEAVEEEQEDGDR